MSAACPGTAIVGLQYQCSISVTDADKNEARLVAFAPQHTCGWALANAQPDGSVFGSPTSDDIGSCTMAFVVTDGAHETTLQSFAVDIEAGVLISPADGNLPSHGFVPQPIGTGVGIVTFTLTNNESVPATELAITGLPAGEFTFTGGSYPGTTGTCTDTLAPGASCTVSIRFAPTVVGEDREIIDIHFTAARGPRSYAFTLSGSGT